MQTSKPMRNFRTFNFPLPPHEKKNKTIIIISLKIFASLLNLNSQQENISKMYVCIHKMTKGICIYCVYSCINNLQNLYVLQIFMQSSIFGY